MTAILASLAALFAAIQAWRTAALILHLLCSAATVWLLWRKGYIVGIRGGLLVVLLWLLSVPGLFVVVLLPRRPPAVVTGCGPGYGGAW